MRVIIVGAPGSGKGTHCKRIVEKYNVAHLSSGDILRHERANNTDLGLKAQSYMDSGGLVPDDLIVAMMAKAVKAAPKAGFVLDGFPRTVTQAQQLDASLEKADRKIDAVISLTCTDDVIMKRLTGRRSCPECGAVYHVTNVPPKKEGICDECGAELVHRPDDTVDVVKNRLDTYRQQTAPVIDYYKSNGEVFEIDGSCEAEETIIEIFKVLDKFAAQAE